MIVDSPLTPKQYRAAARDKMENFRNFWDERFTGHFIGPIFSITHHCYHEWNRRITGERNNAIGFLKKTEDGCRVYFIHTTGIVTPSCILTCFLFGWAFCFLYALSYGLVTEMFWVGAILSGVVTLFMCLLTAICDALTENGALGANTLLELMIDPTFGSDIQEEEA